MGGWPVVYMGLTLFFTASKSTKPWAIRPPPYTPPPQTANQNKSMTGILQRAAAASKNATPALLRLLNNTLGSPCNRYLCNTSFANKSAETLLRMLYDKITTAELAHSFWETPKSLGQPDATLVTDMNLSFYPNLWQSNWLSGRQSPQLAVENATEVFVYNIDPCVNATYCTWQQANDRLIYTTVGGSWTFARNPDPALAWGDITMILRGDAVRHMIGLAPIGGLGLGLGFGLGSAG